MNREDSGPLAGKKYCIYKYGCWMNDRDAETAAGVLESLGCSCAESAADADVLLFNTCSVCEAAEVAALGAVDRVGDGRLVIVLGCMAQRDPLWCADRLPNANIIAGTGKQHRLGEFLLRYIAEGERVVCTDGPEPTAEGLPICRSSAASAYVSIMNGCSNACSYCIVPMVRGRAVCRDSDSVLREVRELVETGCREVTLLGQNALAYSDGSIGFADLLRMVADTGIERVRFLTSHPKDLTVELLKLMAAVPNICKSLHLPVQSGSNRVLRAMNRGYTRERYIELAEAFYELMPEGSLTTDLVTGFPGETEEDHRLSLELYEQLRFDDSYLFAYSNRPGTAAESMDGQLDESVKLGRLNELRRIKESVRIERAEQLCGTVQQLLVEKHDRMYTTGRIDNGWIVGLPLNDRWRPGDMLTVMISGHEKGRLKGALF